MIKKEKPSVVLLHGWGLSGDTFSPLVVVLRDLGYQVESLDFPGFGAADPPNKPWGLKEYADFLNQWLNKRSIKRPVLFGHSFGGRVALKFEQLCPGKSRALILSGTPGYTSTSRWKIMVWFVFSKIGGTLFSLPLLNLIEGPVQLFWYRIIGTKDFLRPQKVMRDTFKKIISESLIGPMQEVRCPCLLIWGNDDRIVPVTIARRMEQTIPGAKLVVVPEARHGVPFKASEAVGSIIDAFIATI